MKDEHIADAALQMHVLERAGLPVHAIEIMHLNPECRHPNLVNLFIRADVTARVHALLPKTGARIAEQLTTGARPPAPVV